MFRKIGFRQNTEKLEYLQENFPEDTAGMQESLPAEDPEPEDEHPVDRLFRKLKEKFLRFWHRHKTVCIQFMLAYFVPVLIVSLIYRCSNVYPIGGECFLKTDMYHQYAPFFSEFRSKLVNGESLFFSWNVGMGVNFFAVMAYYLASPFNWLVAFAGENSVIEFMQKLTVFKIGLCGVAFLAYVRGRARKKNDWGLPFFGIAYALSGYMCAYYWNTMWLDCILLFPLILGALENLVKDGRIFRYALLLGLCITSNYYISIMVCIFLVLYFVALNVLDLPEDFPSFAKRCLSFAAGSLVAGALAAVFLLPAFYALKATASSTSGFPKEVKSYFSVVEMLARMQPIVETEQVLAHWPNIYSGTFVFVLFPLYLMSRRIPVREKAVYCTLSLFMLASFSINVLDYIWHGLHFPNSLPCRQSFCFVFLALFMSFRAYEHKDSYSVRQLGAALTAAVAFLLLVQKDADTKYYDFYVTWVSVALCGLYALVMALYRQRRISRLLAFLCALLLTVSEFSANAAVTGFTTCSRMYYTSDNDDVRALVASVSSEANRDVPSLQEADRDVPSLQDSTDRDVPSLQEDALWRFDKGSRRTKNDGAWLHFPSVSVFSSTANATVTKTMKKLGCEASTNAYSIIGATPLVDMLLSVRWYLSGTDLSLSGEKEVEGRTLVGEHGDTWLYENAAALPIAYVLPERIADGWCFDFDNPVLIQNSICDAVGTGHVLVAEPKTGSSNGSSYTIYTSRAGEYYAYVTSTGVKSASVNIDGTTKKFDNLDRKYLIELGQLDENAMLKFTSDTDGEDIEVSVYCFDYEALQELYMKLSEQTAAVTAWDSDSLEFTISVDAASAGYSSDTNANVFIGTPFDEGWQITVDGVEVKPVGTFNDTFLGLELTDGEHTVKMKYEPQGFRTGLMITAAGIAGLLVLLLIDIRRYRKNLRRKARRQREQQRGTFPLC